MDKIIRVRGTRADVLALKNELENQYGQNVAITEPKLFIGNLSFRQAYRQNELFDILIAVITNLATAVIYDQLKNVVEEYQRRGKIEVHYEDNLKQADTKKETTPESTDNHKDVP